MAGSSPRSPGCPFDLALIDQQTRRLILSALSGGSRDNAMPTISGSGGIFLGSPGPRWHKRLPTYTARAKALFGGDHQWRYGSAPGVGAKCRRGPLTIIIARLKAASRCRSFVGALIPDHSLRASSFVDATLRRAHRRCRQNRVRSWVVLSSAACMLNSKRLGVVLFDPVADAIPPTQLNLRRRVAGLCLTLQHADRFQRGGCRRSEVACRRGWPVRTSKTGIANDD